MAGRKKARLLAAVPTRHGRQVCGCNFPASESTPSQFLDFTKDHPMREAVSWAATRRLWVIWPGGVPIATVRRTRSQQAARSATPHRNGPARFRHCFRRRFPMLPAGGTRKKAPRLPPAMPLRLPQPATAAGYRSRLGNAQEASTANPSSAAMEEIFCAGRRCKQ